jgi:hypothetical protein
LDHPHYSGIYTAFRRLRTGDIILAGGFLGLIDRWNSRIVRFQPEDEFRQPGGDPALRLSLHWDADRAEVARASSSALGGKKATGGRIC